MLDKRPVDVRGPGADVVAADFLARLDSVPVRVPPVPRAALVASAIAIALAAHACRGRPVLTPVEPRGGRYTLSSYGGRRIPVNMGAIPDRDGTATGCDLLISDGELSLDLSGGRFAYSYSSRNGCDQSSLGRIALEGLVTRQGSGLRFRIPRVGGPMPADTVEFLGSFTREAVVVRPGAPDALVFTRSGVNP
jgi:hypothetical protein